MHMKPIHYMLFVLIMGPLIWFSSHMHWGATGTMVCVIVAIVLGGVIIVSSRRVSRRLRHSLGTNRAEATNFLFGPTQSDIRKQELRQAHRQVMARTRVDEWRPPTMREHRRSQPSDSGQRPAQFSSPQYAAQQAMQKTMALPPPSVKSTTTTRKAAPRTANEPNRGRLTLGPNAAMPLDAFTTSGIIIDTPLRPVSPVYVEEWIKAGLGFLVVDMYNQYAPFLAQLPPGFGFLAGSTQAQDALAEEHQARYMAVSGTHEAIQIGKGIVTENLQVIFNFASYQNTTEAGTLLLALLKGLWDKMGATQGQPCAILITDPRPLFPSDETKCVIENSGVAQSLYDHFMAFLEAAQDQEGRERKMAVYLSTPTLAELEEDVLPVCRLWIVNTAAEAEIDLVAKYLELNDDDVTALEDGETLLWDTWAEAVEPITVRFRRSAIALRTATRRRVEAGQRLGEPTGLRTKQDARREHPQPTSPII